MGSEQPRPQWHAMRWRAIGRSVRGATHERSGLPNQDAIRWLPATGLGPPLILSISDGHGSPKYFRSHVGAEQAVKTAAWVIQDLLDGQPDPANLSAIKRTAEDRLPQEIVRRWREAVVDHLQQTPLTPDELGTLESRRDPVARQTVADDPLLAYGATVMTVLVAEAFILYLQLGDGDILVVAEDGTVTRPLERDERHFANQTTSLCTPDAWRDVRIRFQALVHPPPALILLATDGYANSFVDEVAFLQVGSDVLDLIRAEGLAAVEVELETWLAEASRTGSGDDITLGILCRTDVAARPETDRSTESLPVEKETPERAPRALVDPDDEEYVWTVTTHIARVKKPS